MKYLLSLCLFVAVISSVTEPKTDKYRLSYRDSPATSIVIGWNQISGDNPQVCYGKKDAQQDWKKYPLTHTVDFQVGYGDLDNRFARLKNLTPDTAYYFLIKDSEGVSKRYWFKTGPAKAEAFTFIAGGDSRSNHKARKKGNKLVAKLRPLFVLFGGDYTGSGTPKEWATWLDHWQLTISKDGRMYPLLAAHGNHENKDMQMVHKIFDTPNPDMYFSIGFAGDLFRVWTLNSEIQGDKEKWGAQTTWLKNDLAKYPNTKWKAVDYHRPMRPHTKHKGEGLKRIQAWAQLLYDNGIDIVFESDTHMVKRTYPLRPSEKEGSFESFVRDDEKGTVYVGEGSWGAPTRPVNDNKPWTMASASFFQFKWIQVRPTTFESRVVKFENIEKVEALTEKNLFDTPQNLSIWEPATGAVLRLPFKDTTK